MEKRNILFDVSYIKKLPSGNVSVHLYAGRLIKGFEEGKIFHPVALVVQGMESYIDSLAGFTVDKIVLDGYKKVSFSKKLDRLFGLIPFEEELQKKNISIVISPEFIPYTFIYPKKYKHYLIIHDLIQIHRPRTWQFIYYCLMLKWVTFKAYHIISISQNTRRYLKKWAGCDSTVVYNSIPFDFQTVEIPIDSIRGKKYILDVNTITRYKNQKALLEAFNILKGNIPHVLYFKGFNLHNDIEELKALILQLGLEDRVIIDTTNRSEGEMRWLYSHADLFVTPSLEEGFGYTPIEAAVLKTPVLVSNIPTLVEVTRGMLETFDPRSPDELAEKMQRVISDPPSRETLEAISVFFLKEYSLENQIERLTEVIIHNIR